MLLKTGYVVKKPETLRELIAFVMRLERVLLAQPRLHVKDVCLRYGFTKSSLYRHLRTGRFPRPVRFVGPLWRLEDLERAEIAGRIRRP
ncbi:MAG: AlpA family phage regulatory protein [Verrucomicrobiota bacterium]|nr:AlpA family phage regulatory protein [Verrucomicrobiota bacterium]